MRWDGEQLTPLKPQDVERFPFSADDQVRMALFLFNTSVMSEDRCATLSSQDLCSDLSECRASLKRDDFTLAFNTSIGFQDAEGQCSIETSMMLGERCAEDEPMCPDPDDPRCTPTIICLDGDSQPCEVLCGEGWRLGAQTCTANMFGACVAARIDDEICDGIDNNCSGGVDDIDEGLYRAIKHFRRFLTQTSPYVVDVHSRPAATLHFRQLEPDSAPRRRLGQSGASELSAVEGDGIQPAAR